MIKVIGCRSVNLEAQVWSQASTGEICGGQSGSGTGSSTTTSVSPVFLPVRQFPLSVSYDKCSILIHSYIYHPRCVMFFSRYVVSPVSIIPPMLHTHLFVYSSTTHAV